MIEGTERGNIEAYALMRVSPTSRRYLALGKNTLLSKYHLKRLHLKFLLLICEKINDLEEHIIQMLTFVPMT